MIAVSSTPSAPTLSAAGPERDASIMFASFGSEAGLLQAAADALDKLTRAHVDGGIGTSGNYRGKDVPLLRDPTVTPEDDGLTGWARFMLLVSSVQEVVRNAGEEVIRKNLETSKTIRKGQDDLFAANIAEQEKHAKAAQEAAQTMGCMAKIVGGILTGIGIIAGVLTGGWGLILAGIGIGMIAADYIVKAVTGTSLTERALKPLMDEVFMPLVDWVGGVIKDALEKMGAPSEWAEMIGTIVGTITVAVGLLAIAFVFKGLAAKGLTVLRKLFGKMLGKIGARVAAKFSQATSNGMLKGAKNLVNRRPFGPNGEALAAHMRNAEVGVSMLHAGTQSGMGVYVGMEERDMQYAIAKNIEVQFDRKQWDRYVQPWIESWKESLSRVADLSGRQAQIIQDQMSANTFTLDSMRVAI